MAKRILVIDDDEDILSILDILFAEEGYEVVLQNTGTTADQVKLIGPDLILLDVRIVGFSKTGDEICAEIKRELELNDIPVLLVSAEHDVHQRASTCGANGYVNKPFDINKLLEKVKEFIT
ncbi:two-component system response regulator VicR [Pedobacter sp. W3I1]|uniref:response regulator transcription factor n=1 Tax=Pedobacter sp. W3I1 TaxID=3042291 RepID=UPI002785BB91|nr:response regulator [Pedobacter sp. W3I1]MDQ0641203.1 two-component system response regulator VicR [Pedobacter sp. W3I1]